MPDGRATTLSHIFNMITNIAIFLASFAASVFSTNYLEAIKHESAVEAGLWFSLTILLLSVALTSIINSEASILAITIGSFIGTWLGSKIK